MPPGLIPFPFGDCRICNDKATGIHYGVATCEGCKGFFKRTFLKNERHKCFFGGKCVVTPQNRNRCKACRYARCLLAGMSMDGVKMGRIPKADKERALQELWAKESQQYMMTLDSSAYEHPQPAFNSLWLDQPDTIKQPAWMLPGHNRSTSELFCPPAVPAPPPALTAAKDMVQQIVDSGHGERLVSTLHQLLGQIQGPGDTAEAPPDPADRKRARGGDQWLPTKRSCSDNDKLEDIQKFIQDTLTHAHAGPLEDAGTDMVDVTSADMGQHAEPAAAASGPPDVADGARWDRPQATSHVTSPVKERDDGCSDYGSQVSPQRRHTPPKGLAAAPDEATLLENTLQSLLETDLRNNWPLRDMLEKMEQELTGKLQVNYWNSMQKASRANIRFIWNELMQYIGKQNDSIFGLCRDIPGFNTLDPKDQAILMEEGYFAIWLVQNAKLFYRNDSYMRLPCGARYSRFWMRHFLPEHLVKEMFRCTEELNACCLTPTEITVLCAIQLTNPERRGLTNVTQVKVLNSHYLDVLAYEVQRNHQDSHGRILIDIFRILPMLDPINIEQARVIGNFRIDKPPDGCLKFCEEASSCDLNLPRATKMQLDPCPDSDPNQSEHVDK